MAIKEQSIKENVDKFNCIKIFKFGLWKTVNIIKRQATDWQKVFASYISNRGLLLTVQ